MVISLSGALGPSRSIFDPSCIIIETKDLNNTIQKITIPRRYLMNHAQNRRVVLFVDQIISSKDRVFSARTKLYRPYILKDRVIWNLSYFAQWPNIICRDNLNFQHIYLILIATMIYPALKKLDPNHQERWFHPIFTPDFTRRFVVRVKSG